MSLSTSHAFLGARRTLFVGRLSAGLIGKQVNPGMGSEHKGEIVEIQNSVSDYANANSALRWMLCTGKGRLPMVRSLAAVLFAKKGGRSTVLSSLGTPAEEGQVKLTPLLGTTKSISLTRLFRRRLRMLILGDAAIAGCELVLQGTRGKE